MGSKICYLILAGFTMMSGLVGLQACEDNPDECYSDEDCEEGFWCDPTYYVDRKSRSGGVCTPFPDSGESGDADTAPKNGEKKDSQTENPQDPTDDAGA